MIKISIFCVLDYSHFFIFLVENILGQATNLTHNKIASDIRHCFYGGTGRPIFFPTLDVIA